MAEYMIPCGACSEIRAALRTFDCCDLPQGVRIIGTVAGDTPMHEDTDLTLSDVMVKCDSCHGSGVRLTPAGRNLAAAIGHALKGTVIV